MWSLTKTTSANAQRFHEILKELGETHDRKQADYGRDSDSFANIRASEQFGIPAWIGSMVRANDKVSRIQTAASQYMKFGKFELKNESLRDSLIDLAVYAIIALVLMEEAEAVPTQNPTELPFETRQGWEALQKLMEFPS